MAKGLQRAQDQKCRGVSVLFGAIEGGSRSGAPSISIESRGTAIQIPGLKPDGCKRSSFATPKRCFPRMNAGAPTEQFCRLQSHETRQRSRTRVLRLKRLYSTY